ncbi:bestrophin homolog 22 isoform X1 [Zeugodacus cucurbitae]|uniref:bestrophin homolog 22 isoform X1 n=1 Tax=Zeugodacus cucurbitae TaxID=28588 RepID=UPI000596A462|nr:bestrophin homolog 22 isoform X1 [Zeugodacus cucurbitae]XP_011185832.1 bestrophin homolog 22 isoform X1 [Zeugodacus cucurbitae]XP_011185834.1 bestrophin homolog 22 isoform X1 [Zeugodacus cucurbitae]XP_054081867.1 bestrophin homolog 22 isoform X1 [Zeugodacus cucurbitae]
MTVTYTAEVATCRGFGCFLKLLRRWRGSIYKLVWLDLIAFLFLYYLLSIVYRFCLDEYQKKIFEGVAKYCYSYSDLIPLSFVLGFYVSIVMTRWWNQYTSIPWPDPIAVFVSSNVHGQDERGRVMRRTIMRYVCLCLTMVLINVSPRVKKRFPDLTHLVDAGLLNDNEKAIIESMNKGFPRHSKHWLPIVWAASIITRARKEGRIRDDFAVKTIIDELNKFRGQCGLLISYDTISVPLVYTQVVTLAVYSFFLCSVMGQQWTEDKQAFQKIDIYFPVFTTLQFFFYMGWLKVAESLINPFGEDDDDFEVNWMVDRNLQVSYLIVDEMHHDHPELIKDQYWDEVFPNELPYTVASERFREEHPEPSTAKIEVSNKAAMPTTLSSVRIDEMVGSRGSTKRLSLHEQAQNSDQTQTQTPMQAVNYKFPEMSHEEEADDASGIHFTAGNGKVRHGSSPSIVSLSGTLTRVNTVASALKRFLSRDERPGSTTPVDDGTQKMRFPGSASSASLTGNLVMKPPGSLRITDQVIEEVDEQATITSHRANDQVRPNLQDIFLPGLASGSNAAHSEPMDIPPRPTSYMRTQSTYEPTLFPPGGVEALLSTSAPTNGSPRMVQTVPNSPVADPSSTKSLFDRQVIADKGSREAERPPEVQQVFRWYLSTVDDMDTKSTTDAPGAEDEGDDFDKLKATREKERLQRQQQKLARTISTAPGIDGGPTVVPVVAAAIIPTTVVPAPAPAVATTTVAAAAPAAPPAAAPVRPLSTISSGEDLLTNNDPDETVEPLTTSTAKASPDNVG